MSYVSFQGEIYASDELIQVDVDHEVSENEEIFVIAQYTSEAIIIVLSTLLCNAFNDCRTELQAAPIETTKYFKRQWTRHK